MAVVRFVKPTLNFAVGDIADLDETYLKEVVDKYIKRRFSGDERNRYVTETGLKKLDKPKSPTINELTAEAIELGIDVTGLSKKELKQKISELS